MLKYKDLNHRFLFNLMYFIYMEIDINDVVNKA